jgi:uncharacterized protein YxeA
VFDLKALINLYQDQRGVGTLEIILILVVILAIAIAFRKYIVDFFNSVLQEAATETKIIEQVQTKPITK